jgi:hypothetical protein
VSWRSAADQKPKKKNEEQFIPYQIATQVRENDAEAASVS